MQNAFQHLQNCFRERVYKPGGEKLGRAKEAVLWLRRKRRVRNGLRLVEATYKVYSQF